MFARKNVHFRIPEVTFVDLRHQLVKKDRELNKERKALSELKDKFQEKVRGVTQ